MSTAQIILAFYATCAAIVAIAARLAPLGYEDAAGWHAGREGAEAGEFRTIHNGAIDGDR